MPFIRSDDPESAAPLQASSEDHLAQLVNSDWSIRRQAARFLADRPEAVPELAARLLQESDPSVRCALFNSLATIGGVPVAWAMVSCIRSQDAGLRGGALDVLKQIGVAASAPAVDSMLDDADADLRLLAIEVARAWPEAAAGPRLCRLIDMDPSANVCGAAVDVATDVGGEPLLASLRALPSRFPDEPYLAFAADVACRHIAQAAAPAPDRSS